MKEIFYTMIYILGILFLPKIAISVLLTHIIVMGISNEGTIWITILYELLYLNSSD